MVLMEESAFADSIALRSEPAPMSSPVVTKTAVSRARDYSASTVGR